MQDAKSKLYDTILIIILMRIEKKMFGWHFKYIFDERFDEGGVKYAVQVVIYQNSNKWIKWKKPIMSLRGVFVGAFIKKYINEYLMNISNKKKPLQDSLF